MSGLQLIEAQDVWGIAFPPNDWLSERREEDPPKPGDPADSERQDAAGTEAAVPSLAGEEITIRLLQELQQSADAHAQEFQDRLKQLTHRLGLEFEFDLRERAAHAKAREVGALEEEIRVLRESLSAAREEMGKLEARIQELKCGLEAATANPPPPPLQEARRQLTALANSVVESMNHAAEAGLSEYRSLLQKENQANAARAASGRGRRARRRPEPIPRILTPFITKNCGARAWPEFLVAGRERWSILRQAMQVRVTHLHRFQRRLLAPVLLNEVVLHPPDGRGGEDALPIDGAVTHGREHAHLVVLLLRGGGMVLHVLDVEQREAARVFLEVGHRILAGVRHPEAIHLKFHEFRIERFEQVIIRRGVADIFGIRSCDCDSSIEYRPSGFARRPC